MAEHKTTTICTSSYCRATTETPTEGGWRWLDADKLHRYKAGHYCPWCVEFIEACVAEDLEMFGEPPGPGENVH